MAAEKAAYNELKCRKKCLIYFEINVLPVFVTKAKKNLKKKRFFVEFQICALFSTFSSLCSPKMWGRRTMSWGHPIKPKSFFSSCTKAITPTVRRLRWLEMILLWCAFFGHLVIGRILEKRVVYQILKSADKILKVRLG